MSYFTFSSASAKMPDMEMQGFELCKGVLSFRRYVMEKNDIGMEDWMRKNLGEEDYQAYYKTIEERRKFDNI